MKEIAFLIMINTLILNTYAQNTNIAIPEIEVISEQIISDDTNLENDNFYFLENTHAINQAELKRRNPDHITDLLQDIPGVNITGGASPTFRQVFIRGMSGFRVIQQVDGARRYEQTQSSFSNSIGLEADSLKRVEVQKGAESLTKANGAIGGAVLYRTLDPSDLLKGEKKSAIIVKGSFNSATKSLAQTITGAVPVAPRTGLLLQAIRRKLTRTQSGGEQEQSSTLNYLRESYMAKLENKSSLGKVTTKASYSTTENNDTSYRSGYDDATTNYTDSTAEATINHHFISPNNPFINLENSLFINRRKSEKDTHTPWLGFESTVGRSKDIIDQRGIRSANRSVLPLSEKHFLETEIGLSHSQMKASEIDGSDQSFYGISKGSDQGLFTMNNLNLFNDTFIIKAGARINHYERSSEKLAVAVKETNGSTFSNILGFTVKPLPFVDLFAKMSNSNRAPEVRELYLGGGQPFACHFPRKICNNMPNSNLQEENAYGREVGVNFHHKGNFFKSNLKVSYFYEKISNFIETMPKMYRIENGRQAQAGPDEATHRDYRSLNLNNVLRQGIEAELNASFNHFDFSAKYSAMNIDCLLCPVMFDATTTSEPLYTAPADKLVTHLGYSFPALNLNIGYRGSFVAAQKRLSQRYQQAGFATPGYSVHGAFIGWEPIFQATGKFRLDLAMDNFTNKQFKVHNSGTGAFELGQNFKISLSKYF